jgi:hypothetical protein
MELIPEFGDGAHSSCPKVRALNQFCHGQKLKCRAQPQHNCDLCLFLTLSGVGHESMRTSNRNDRDSTGKINVARVAAIQIPMRSDSSASHFRSQGDFALKSSSSAAPQSDSLLHIKPKQKVQEVTFPNVSIASSTSRLRYPVFELPHRTPTDTQDSADLSPANEDTSVHDELVGLISLPALVHNKKLSSAERSLLSLESPFPTKRANVVLAPKRFSRHQLSSECVLLHSFVYSNQEAAEFSNSGIARLPSGQIHECLRGRPGTATQRQSKNTAGSILSAIGAEDCLYPPQGQTSDIRSLQNTKLIVTEKNSGASVFVQKLMSHISTQIAASEDVSMMTQQSVIFADKDGHTEGLSMNAFSHGAAGLQLAFVAKLNAAFQLRKYFLWMKELTATAKYQRHKQLLDKKMKTILAKDRVGIQNDISSEFAGVLTKLCSESKLALIRNSSDQSWSTDSLQKFFSVTTEDCSGAMLNACAKLANLLKTRFDVGSRILNEGKKLLISHLLILQKPEEAHQIAAEDLLELSVELSSAMRYIIAWVHKILINILQSVINYFSLHHVDVKNAMALLCTWSTDNHIILSPSISEITGIIQIGFRSIHDRTWSIFAEHCCCPSVYERFHHVTPHLFSQMHVMKQFHSEYALNWFVSTRLSDFIELLTASYECIFNVVEGDALSAVNQAKVVELEVFAVMKSIPADQFATFCRKYYRAVQESLQRLESVPSNFHKKFFCLNTKSEFSIAQLHLQKVWELQFAQSKQRFKVQADNFINRISKITSSMRCIDLPSRKDEELIQSSYELHKNILIAEDALPHMQLERKALLTVSECIISCSSPGALLQYWEDFQNTIHFKAIIEEIASAKKSMMRSFDRLHSLFATGQEDFTAKLGKLNSELEEIDEIEDFSAKNVVKTCDRVKVIVGVASEVFTHVSTLLDNYTSLCSEVITKPKNRQSEVVLRRTPQDLQFIATILTEKSQSYLNNWTQLSAKSQKLERIFGVNYADACNNFLEFAANLYSIEFDTEESMDIDFFQKFLSFHSERIVRLKSLYPFLKISIPKVKDKSFHDVMNIILPVTHSQIDQTVTFAEILDIWLSTNEEQQLLIREWIKHQTDVAEKINLAQSAVESATSHFIWKNVCTFQEVRFPQYLGYCSVFVNPSISDLMNSCELHIDAVVHILSTLESALDDTRSLLAQFLEDFYVARSFLQAIFACSYWSCCMLTITFERRGDEDHESFLTWGGDPDQLDARNTAIKSYKNCMASVFQYYKSFADESLFAHLCYIRHAILNLSEVTGQMRNVYENYRDFTFFPMSLTWFPSIILIEENLQDAGILSLGPADSSRACRCFSSLMDAAKLKLFMNVSRITYDKEFGQPSTLTTHCGRSIGVEASMTLFGRSINLSLLLKARSIKNAFKKCYLQTINRFHQQENSSFCQLFSSTQLKDQLLEGVILAALVKLSSVDKDDQNCRIVAEMMDSLLQVAKDAAEGNIQSATALALLIIVRDSCSSLALRTVCCWKFNYEEQSVRLEVGSDISVSHNLEVSPNMNWLLFLNCDDSYLIKCLQAVALSPRVLETQWDHNEHSAFSQNLASLTGRQRSIGIAASSQIKFWIEAVSASKGFGILISDSLVTETFPFHQFIANVLRIGSVFWWASKSLNVPMSDMPNVLSTSSLLPFFHVSEFESAHMQMDCMYRTFRIIPHQISVVRKAQEMPLEIGKLTKSFGKLSHITIPCSEGKRVVLSKQFVISRATTSRSTYSCFDSESPQLSASNLSACLSSGIKTNRAHETIKTWIQDRQKIVISGRSLCGKSTLIANVLKECISSGSAVQRFFWDGVVPISSRISPDELEFVQLEILRMFYANKSISTTAIAWIDCPEFCSFPSSQVAGLNVLPLIIETQCISHLDPASLCTFNHYFLDGDDVFNARDVLLERITQEASDCLVRKTSAVRFNLVRRVHQFFTESLKFVFQHCSFSHNLRFSDIHFIENFSILMKSCCLQMKQLRYSTFGPSWWKKYNLCSETAFYHMSVFCTVWSVGGCLSQKHQDNFDVWVRTLGFEMLNVQSLVDLKITSIFNCILSSSVASNGLRLQNVQDYELLERFAALGDVGLFCPSPKHYMCREIMRLLRESGHMIALLGPSESGKSLFLKSLCKNLESSETPSGCSFVSFDKPSFFFRNIKALIGTFRDSSKAQGSFNILIDDFHVGLGNPKINHHVCLENAQVYGVIRSVICNRTICLVDREKQNRLHSVSIFREPVVTCANMIFGVSTSAPQFASPLLYNILASSFLLQPDSMNEQTFQVICSRAVDLKLRRCDRTSTPIVEFSMPIMSSVLYRAHEILVANMRRMLLPHYYDIPSYSYLASTLLRLVDTFGCTRRNNDVVVDRKKTRTFDFLAYVRAATSGVQKARQAVANSVQDEYYLDPGSVWKAFAIHFRDLTSHFLSSHLMFEIERMIEESYFAEMNKTIASAMSSVGCEHGGQLDAILSPIAKYILASEPDPNASFIIKSLPGDLSLQSYEEMWKKYIYDGQEFKFKFMLGLMQNEQNISNSLSQISGAFHQLAHFLKFQDRLLRIRCYEGAEFLNLIELCESLKVFRYFSVRHIDVLDDPKVNLRSEILDSVQRDHYVVFAINLQCNAYLETSHINAANLHRALIAHIEILNAIVIEKKPANLFDTNEILQMANHIHSASSKQKSLSLEAATEILVSELSSRFKFVIAVDANPHLPTSMHEEYFAFSKLRSNSSVCSLFAVTLPSTFGLVWLYRQYQHYEVACKNWKQAGLTVAGLPMASFKMDISGYLLLTSSIVNQLSTNSIFEIPYVSKLLQNNLELFNMVCVKFMFHTCLFRDQLGLCVEKLQQCLNGINVVIKIHSAASSEVNRLRAQLIEQQALLESLQAKYKVERSVFQQASNESIQIAQSKQSSLSGTGPVRVSTLFSSSSYGRSILETSRCVNEVQKLSDVDIAGASKAISEPKSVEERLISELFITIFQYTQLGLTPATFSKSSADFKYRIASLSVLQLPASSFELIMRFVRNPLLQLSENSFYTNRLGLKLMMEWIQSIACQIYSRKKSVIVPICDDFDANVWVASILKRHSFLDDAASALRDKNVSSIEMLQISIQELQSELRPLETILRSIKSIEPTLREIKSKAKARLRKFFTLEPFCEEISFMYSFISIICLQFCRENQDRFFEIIKDLTSDASLTTPGTVFNTIFSRFFVTMSKENPISFQFLHSTDLKSFISLCVTILYAKDLNFLFQQNLDRFSDYEANAKVFKENAIASMCPTKAILLLKDSFENEAIVPSIHADFGKSELEKLVLQNVTVTSNLVSCCSELVTFCDNFDQMIQESSQNDSFNRITVVPISTGTLHHDPFYSMESTQKVKEYGSKLTFIDEEGVSRVSDAFRLVLPINPYSVLRSIPLEGIPMTGFQMINCQDFEKSFASALVRHLMNFIDTTLYQNLTSIRRSLTEFTQQSINSLTEICSHLCEICDHVGGFEGDWNAASPSKCAETLARSVPFSASYRQLAPLLDACIESLGPCLHFESNWLEVSQLITASVVWLLSTASCIPSLRYINWKNSIPKSFLLRLKRFPLQMDPIIAQIAQNYRGHEALSLANHFSSAVGKHLRHCMSNVALDYSVHFDVVITLMDVMAMTTSISGSLSFIEKFTCSNSLPFLRNIALASYFYKLQLPAGLREFESSQNASLQVPRSFWSLKSIFNEFIDSHPDTDLNAIPDYDISSASHEIRTLFVLFHVLTFNSTHLDKHDIENPSIINAEFKKSCMPECITDRRLYILRFLNIILADHFDKFIENLRILNSRPAFVEELGQIHFESLLSLLKRQPFSENVNLVSLLGRLLEPSVVSPYGGLITAFLLGPTSFLTFFISQFSVKPQHQHTSTTESVQNHDRSIVDLWSENGNF